MLAQLDFGGLQKTVFPNSRALNQTSVGGLIGDALPFIFGAAGIALLIYLVVGGFQFMLSRGDPKAAQAAQAKITNAVIGFIIVFFSYTLVAIIGKVFGINAFGEIFK